MVRLVALCALLGACFEDRYRCESDADCDRGPGARCELAGFCSSFDATCATERRFDEHSAELADTCVSGQVALANPCAGGQPAAVPEGCAASVCEALPACCDVGWSDACAQQAQLRCDLRCDTRIAVTANRGTAFEHWDLVWDGATWTATQRTDRSGMIAWIGPEPGTVEPRFVGFDVDQTTLLVGDRPFPADPARTYLALTSVDFDRSGRDTLAVAFDAGNVQQVQLIDLATGQLRDLRSLVALRLTWGDSDRDGFPDGIAGRAQNYTLLRNVDNDFHVREIEATQTSAFGGGNTPGQGSAIRSLDWLDINADGKLDLVAFGNQIRVHADEGALRDTPLFALDCDPLRTGCGMPESLETSYAGAALPTRDGAELVVAMFTDPVRNLDRKLSRITLGGPAPGFRIAPLADSCPTCLEIVAVIARDLDGDHILDVIGLDTKLQIYTALSGGDGILHADPFPGSAGSFNVLSTTVTGVPMP